MKTRRLGKSDLVVSAVGLGCMSMTPFYGVPDEAESVATLRRAVDVGVTLFDTALYYGDGRNEEIVGATLKDSATTSPWRRSAASTPNTRADRGTGPTPNTSGSAVTPVFTGFAQTASIFGTCIASTPKHRWKRPSGPWAVVSRPVRSGHSGSVK